MAELSDAAKTKPPHDSTASLHPDVQTKYRTAGQIAEKVLAAVSELCVPGAKFADLCEQGDKMMEEEIGKVYRGKSFNKGFSHPVTVSGSAFVTPYTPLKSDATEALAEMKAGDPIKIQLGAQIDGHAAILCNTVLATAKDQSEELVTGRAADLLLAGHYANELLLRLLIPPGLLASGTEEEKALAAKVKAPTAAKMTSLLEKVVKSYDCNLIEGTTSWLFTQNDVEGKKRIVLAPADNSAKAEPAVPAVTEVWGVEVGVSLGSGKLKTLTQRPTLHRRTSTTYGLKRPTSRRILSEIQKKFNNFPFSLRQLDDERDAKSGVVECVRSGVLRQYEIVGDKDGAHVGRLFTTVVITKNGITKLGAPPALDRSKVKSDKKITDEEVLKILALPLSKTASKSKSKNKKKKKKSASASAETGAEASTTTAEKDDSAEESDDE